MPKVNSKKGGMSFFSMGSILAVLYLVAVLASTYYRSLMIEISTKAVTSPWVGKHNATRVVRTRLETIQKDFEGTLLAEDWRVLRSTSDIKIEIKKNPEGWPDYIRTTTILNAKPADAYNLFTWENFDETQKKIDPFYESSAALLDPTAAVKVIEKTTKRPLFYPKRRFTMALLEQKQNKDIAVAPKHALLPARITRGTLTSVLVNVNVAHEDESRNRKYVSAFQDFMAWFVEGEQHDTTVLVIVMRVDLGDDIPKWAFLSTVAATGISSMKALQRLALEAKKDAAAFAALNSIWDHESEAASSSATGAVEVSVSGEGAHALKKNPVSCYI